jgi:hypothetical protein
MARGQRRWGVMDSEMARFQRDLLRTVREVKDGVKVEDRVGVNTAQKV